VIPVALPGDNGLPTAKEEDKDPAYELNKNGIVHRYRYDPTKPDGKGEYIGTMPAFPQGCDDWANARLYNCAKNDRQDEEGEDIMAPKISRVVRPNKDELQALFIKCKGSINKISNELSIGWTTAQKWLIDDGIIPEGAKQLDILKMFEQPAPPPPPALDPPKPWKAALAPDVIKMCELPEDYLDRITVRSVSFSYGGPDGTMGATISAGMHLEESYQDLNLNTPHKASAMYNPDTPDDEMQLLSSDCIERLEALQEECEAYIKGDRAQGSLFSVA